MAILEDRLRRVSIVSTKIAGSYVGRGFKEIDDLRERENFMKFKCIKCKMLKIHYVNVNIKDPLAKKSKSKNLKIQITRHMQTHKN